MKRLFLRVAGFLILSLALQADEFTLPPVKSGYDFLSRDMQAVQDDDFLSPGMAAVEEGRELFHRTDEEGKSCADCHGTDGEKLSSARIASFPRFDSKRDQLMTLQNRIQVCWTERLDRFPDLLYDEPRLIRLEAFVRNLARGEVINVEVDPAGSDWYEKGKRFYNTRFGQMDMTCQHCHVIYQGQLLRGQRLTQGQSNGFPVYRFNSDRVTSLHQRFDECFEQLRAAPYEAGSDEYRALEYYMGTLSNGLKVETPGVRF